MGFRTREVLNFFFKTFETKITVSGFEIKKISSLLCYIWSLELSCKSLVGAPIAF
jgi:hypothetical protein